MHPNSSNNICLLGWGSITHWSKYQNIENEKIFCRHPDQSYIVQAKSRWTDEDDDNKQIAWHCSPPDSSNKKKDTPSHHHYLTVSALSFITIVFDIFQIWSPEIAETLTLGPMTKEKTMHLKPHNSVLKMKSWLE